MVSNAAFAICMLSIVAPIQCNIRSDQNGDEVSLMQKRLKLEEHPKVIATNMKQVKGNLDGNVDLDGNEGNLRENVKDMLGDKISQLQEDSKANGYVSIGQGACGGNDAYGTRTFAVCTADCNQEEACSAIAFKTET